MVTLILVTLILVTLILIVSYTKSKKVVPIRPCQLEVTRADLCTLSYSRSHTDVYDSSNKAVEPVTSTVKEGK